MESVPRLGQLVYSRAGRDRGRAMVVVGVCDARHVLVCDGELHPAARPKRKNIRHLAAATAVYRDIAGGAPPEDAALRAWLQDAARAEGGEA